MRRSIVVALLLTVPIGGIVVIGSGPAGAADIESAFVDDDWLVHEPDINGIAAAGITKGCNPPANDRFCPHDPVSRGQMAAFLVRAFELPRADPSRFTDISDSIFAGDIDRIAATGITIGCDPPANDRFCPDDPVNRGQMASFLARALDLEPVSNGRFTDVSSSVHEPTINAIAAAEITIGCNPPTNDRFCPSQPVTRAQMASFLVRAVDGVDPIHNRLSLRTASPCTKDRIRCSSTFPIPPGRPFVIREGWFHVLPYRSGEQAAFTAPTTRFELTINGAPVFLAPRSGDSPAMATRQWSAFIPGLSPGTHTLRGLWRWQGHPDLVVTVVVTTS